MEKNIRDTVDVFRSVMRRDGGDVSLLGYDAETETVRLRFFPGSYHCPGVNGAMQMLFEKKLRQDFPEIGQVIFQDA